MDHVGEVRELLAEIQKQCTAGFAVALHISFSTPKFLFQTYDQKWARLYSEKGLVVHDPTVRWGLENVGMIDWSDLAESDPAKVLDLARQHGIHFGITFSVVDDGSRSIGSFANLDMDFDLKTKTVIQGLFAQLHRATLVDGDVTEAISDELKRLSVELTHGWKASSTANEKVRSERDVSATSVHDVA